MGFCGASPPRMAVVAVLACRNDVGGYRVVAIVVVVDTTPVVAVEFVAPAVAVVVLLVMGVSLSHAVCAKAS